MEGEGGGALSSDRAWRGLGGLRRLTLRCGVTGG